MELYIFSQDEQPLTVLSEETGLIDTHYRIEINGIPDEPFIFSVEADNPTAAYVKEENKVIFRDHEGDWRLMVIREVDDSNDLYGPITLATCEPVSIAELNDNIIEERRFSEQPATRALEAALQGTRWLADVESELGNATSSFYYLTSTEAVWKVLDVWGGEFKDVVDFDEETNEIKGCYIKLIQRHGSEHGQRFEIDNNTTEIGRTVLSYPKTALYGRGSSLEVEDEDGEHTGGYTRYIDFAEVEWKVSNGNPVDKPKGQKWVGDPEALAAYGYENGDKHRYGIFSNQDYEDPADLLQATWESLQDAKKPEVNYRLSAQLFNEKVSLGDTSQAIDRKFARPIEIQARVIAMEYDLMDIEGTMVIEMGQFLDLGDNRIDDLERKVEDIENRPPPPARIDEGSYPNIKPGTPVNVEAYGGMEVIQLYWEYASQIYVKHYEVYGSRTEDFIPDSQHLLWRGNTSAFSHTVGTDEVWYYRIRAVNYHGTPSDWSEQVRAATHRVISDDILWGPELAERMRELHRISDIIGEGGVDFDQISQEAKDLINRQARIYTDEEIQATRDGIMDELDIRTDDLYDSVADLNQRAQDLINRADNVDDILYDYNVRIDETERGLEFKADSLEVDLINRTVEGHTTEIEILAEGLSSKVSETFVREAIGDIEIGARNLLPNSKGDNLDGWSTFGGADLRIVDSVIRVRKGASSSTYGARTNSFEVVGEQKYTVSLDVASNFRVSLLDYMYLMYEDDNGNQGIPNIIMNGAHADLRRYSITFTANRGGKVHLMVGARVNEPDYASEGFLLARVQVERGNKATDWSPAPEDILSVQEKHSTSIDQNSRAISLQAESILNMDGLIRDTQTEINIMSDEINQRVTETIFNEETGYLRQSLSDVRQLANEIEQTVSSIEIGGRNLIRNSKGNTLDGWYHWHSSQYLDITNRLGYDWIWARKPPTNATMGVHTPTFNLKANKTYICSFLIRSLSNSGYDLNYLYLRQGENTITTVKSLPDVSMRSTDGFDGDISGDGLRVWFTFSHEEDIVDARLLLAIRDRPEGAGFVIREIKIAEGNMLTDWSPSPEDTDNRMTIAESRITQLSDDITLKVDVDSIVSEINVNREGIRLSGALIHLNGLSLIDEAIIQNAHIANGAIDRAKLGTAVIGTAQIENGAITNAKIANATIDNAKIASLSATKLTAGTIDGNIVKIQGGSSIDYTLIDGSLLESRGRFTRTWRGITKTHDVRIMFQNGYIRARNDSENHSIYFSDYGISTYSDATGSGAPSGTIAFRDTEYSTAGGVTVNSGSGVVALRSDNNRIVIDSHQTVNLESNEASIYFRPMKQSRTGNNEFRMWVKDRDDAGDSDGVLSYGSGSDNLDHASGLRFKKSTSGDPIVHITNGVGDFNSGKAQAISFIGMLEAPSDNAYIGVNDRLRITSKAGYNNGNVAYRDLQMAHAMVRSIRLNTEISGTHFYLGVSTGELRVTSNLLADGAYRPIRVGEVILDGGGRLVFENDFTYIQGNNEIRASRVRSSTLVPVRAASFPTGSSEKVKENIVKFEKNALDIVRNSVIYEYNRIGLDCRRELGFIIERETPNEVLYDDESVNGYSHSSLNTKAIQELDAKLTDEINWQRIEYQVLKNRVTKLEERIEELEEMVV
ncbi:phage tail spike protein [Oceanobacillus sojae]|uniref:phage tail spike protein n=1 Tax=Oceanobacillus sojae TaxID=582851 RepID=UPI003638DFCD